MRTKSNRNWFTDSFHEGLLDLRSMLVHPELIRLEILVNLAVMSGQGSSPTAALPPCTHMCFVCGVGVLG